MVLEEQRVLRGLHRVMQEMGRDVAPWAGQAGEDLTQGRLTPAAMDAVEAYLRERPTWIFDDAAVLRQFNRVLARHGRLPRAPDRGQDRRTFRARIVSYQGIRYIGL